MNKKKTVYTYIEIELSRQQWWGSREVYLLNNRTNAKILTTGRVKLTL